MPAPTDRSAVATKTSNAAVPKRLKKARKQAKAIKTELAADQPSKASSDQESRRGFGLRTAMIAVLGLCMMLGGAWTRWSRAEPAAASLQAAAGVQPARLKTMPIADIRPGMRVLADNPLDEDLQGYGFEVDPDTWSELHLEMQKEDGSKLRISLLRPDEWIEELEAYEGSVIDLELDEMGASGPATVVGLNPYPEIQQQGEGQVVTGRFEHEAATVLDLQIEGETDPIGTTASHPFFSADRQEFVKADELRVGERLQTEDGKTPQILSIQTRPGRFPVFNLEVNVEHVYFVGRSGLLVHNFYKGYRATKYYVVNGQNYKKVQYPDGWRTYSLNGNNRYQRIRRPGRTGPMTHARKYHDEHLAKNYEASEIKQARTFERRRGQKRNSRIYDAQSTDGRDIEYKSDNWSRKKTRQQMFRTKKQIAKDRYFSQPDNVPVGDAANPYWHFKNDPRVSEDGRQVIAWLDQAGIPWNEVDFN